MAELLKFELVSPEKLLMSEDVQYVTVPGTEGDFTVMPRHAPVLSTIRPGVITVLQDGGGEERIFIRGGFAEVNPEGLTLLAEEAVPMADVSRETLDRHIKDLEEDVADASSDEKRARVQEALDHLKQLHDAL